jgi:hypothetical protein
VREREKKSRALNKNINIKTVITQYLMTLIQKDVE